MPATPEVRARENRPDRRGSVGSVTAVILTRPGGIVVASVLDALAGQDRTPDRVVITGLAPDSEEVDEANGHPLITGGVELRLRPPLPARGGSPARLGDILADAVREVGPDAGSGSEPETAGQDSTADPGDVAGSAAAEQASAEDSEDPAAAGKPSSSTTTKAGKAEKAAPSSQRPLQPEGWWWILTDDSRPRPGALSGLIDATRRSSGVGVVGPKLLDREDPRRLVAMGYKLTRTGRPAGSVQGEFDQGQYDRTSDTLGVPLAGMFIQASVLAELDGPDPAFDEGTEGLDLSWRSHLAGHRVVLAPSARVELSSEGLGIQRPWQTRVRTRQLALARGSALALPWRTLSIALVSLVAAFGLLLVKRPRDAGGEMADVVAMLAPWRGLGARWRNRSRVTVPRRHLRGLFDTSATAWRGTADLVQDAFTPRAAGSRRSTGSALESGPVGEDQHVLEHGPSRPWWSWPVVIGLLAVTTLTAVRWRELLPAFTGSGVGVSGGELSVQTAGSSDLWQSWWGAWSGSGLGSSAPAEPWLLPMTALTWLVEGLPWVSATASSAGLAASLLLLLAMPLSFITFVLAARAVTDRRWPRVFAALGWAVLPPLTAALTAGRIGPVVAHILAPLIVAGLVAALSRGPGTLRTAAAFATALATAVVALFVPGVLLLVSLAGLFGLILAPGVARWRALVLTVVPWVLTGPWLPVLLENPRLLLGGAGATVTDASVPSWQLLLLHPGGPTSVVLWWTVPILALALLGTLRSGPRGARLSVLAFGAAIGLGFAVAASLISLGPVPEGYSNAGAQVGTWPGTYLSIAGAALLLGAVGTLRAIDGRLRWADWRQSGVAAGGGIAAAAVAGLALSTVWAGTGPLIGQGEQPHLAVAQTQADGPDSTRILILEPRVDSIGYRLEGREPHPWQRDMTRELTPVTATPSQLEGQDESSEGDQVAAVVEQITGYQGEAGRVEDAGADATPQGSEVGIALHGLAVGYVQVSTTAESDLAEQIDAVPGLVRLGGTAEVQLWRVTGLGASGEVAATRVRLVDAEGEPAGALSVDGSHARLDTGDPVELPAGGAMLISQTREWAENAEVRIGDDVLEPRDAPTGSAVEADPAADAAEAGPTADLPLVYPIPQSAGGVDGAVVTVNVLPADRLWYLITAGLAVVVAFLALPFGGRRRRQ